MTLLNRYLGGEHKSVWLEIRDIPNLEACKSQDVRAVATATMERVRHNADLIASRLHDAGWKALGHEYSELRMLPSPHDIEVVKRIEAISGAPMPLSFLTFWEVVGGINWVWDYESGERDPELGAEVPLVEMDPLCVYPPSAAAYQLDEWESGEHQMLTGLNRVWRLDLAPDYLHKANISGGDAYAIYLPSSDPDPIFENERHRLPFLDYLRLAFEWAGFPELANHKDRGDVREFVCDFRQGLVEF